MKATATKPSRAADTQHQNLGVLRPAHTSTWGSLELRLGASKAPGLAAAA